MLDNKVVIALGYFDSVHKGHRLVLDTAKRCAKKHGASFVVFTFDGNVKSFFTNQPDKSIYTSEERLQILNELGVDQVFFAPTTSEFLSLSKQEFLDFLCEKYNVVAYVSGEDYTFGKFGSGNVDYLREYASAHGQEYVVVDTLLSDAEKVSTTRVKSLLSKGDVKGANALLVRHYSVAGRVCHDRKVGKKLGFPTINLHVNKHKFNILDGVYKGHVFIDSVKYDAIINYGARPTFNLDEKLLEAHILDFDGDLYDREITVFFDQFMRNIQKFSSSCELQSQLQTDLQNVKGGKYD